jgi:hypothetical protein
MLMSIHSVFSGGCQIVSGLTVLQITGGAGGEGGDPECASSSDCGTSTDCSSYTCDSAGKCQQKDAVSGALCDPSACGDGEVLFAGKCDGAGACVTQAKASPKLCPMNYGCDPATRECTTLCVERDDCSSTGFCVGPTKRCEVCGTHPNAGPCTPGSGSCEACDVDACVETCDAVGECTGIKVLDAGGRPARLVCDGQCKGLTVNCQGPHLCEVVCDGDGCDGLIMNCSKDGACKITCTDTACTGVGGVVLNCGENACNAICAGAVGAEIEAACKESCGCSKQGCQ